MSETELCRLCAKVTNDLNAEKLFEQNQHKLLRQIEELMGQRLRNAKTLPQHICKICQEQTLQAHAFRERCIRTQEHFARQLKKERHQQKNCKLKDTLSASPFTDGLFLHDFNVVKEEKEVGQLSPLPEPTEVLLKHEPTISEEGFKVSDDSNHSCNPLDVDQYGTMNDDNKKSNETEISWSAAGDEKPILAKRPKVKPYKKQKCTTKAKTKCENNKQKSNGRKFICDQCGKHFVSNSDLESHIRRHKGERPFKCEICPESFFLKVGLKRHIRKHAGELPYPCGHCERRFLDKCHALKHERTHTNERPYICQQCGKGFTVSHILKAHMLVHTGERAFSCKLCNAAFKLKKHLVTHCRSLTHKQNEEKQQMRSCEVDIAAAQNIGEISHQNGFS